MHVCFAVLVGWPMSRLVRRRPFKVLWLLYPLLITFVVVATGNHYLTDVFLGGVHRGDLLDARRPPARPGAARACGTSAPPPPEPPG